MAFKINMALAVAVLAARSAAFACSPTIVAATPPAAHDKMTTARVAAVANVAAGSQIKIKFTGAISHVFGYDKARAVLIRDQHHSGKLVIVGSTNIKPTPDASTRAIKDVLVQIGAATVSASCNSTTCEVWPLEGLVIRVNESIAPALNTDCAFKELVPSLSKVAKMQHVDQHVYAPAPPKGTEFTSFFELTGGTLTATAYPDRMSLCPDHEGRGLREFARTVELSGTTAAPASLEFSTNGKDWSTLSFDNSAVLDLQVGNDPSAEFQQGAHIEVHAALAEGKLPDYPKIGRIVAAYGASGSTVACGNTTYP